jgi:hypothetical protein
VAPGILGKLEAAASTEPSGMQAVMKGMQPSRRYTNLRTEFDNPYQQDPILWSAYDKMVDSVPARSRVPTSGAPTSPSDGPFQRAA